MTAICIGASLFFLLLKAPLPQPGEKDVTIGNSLRDSTNIQNETSVKADVIETFNLMISSRMLKLIPLIFWTAISLSIFAGLFVPIMTDTMATNSHSSIWSD